MRVHAVGGGWDIALLVHSFFAWLVWHCLIKFKSRLWIRFDMVESESTYYTTIINPNESAFRFNFKELWQRRYLLWLFVKRDLTVQYKQTILGFAWYFVGPVITMLTYLLVFGKIAGIPTDGIPQPLFYLSGICLWEYFSTCLLNSSQSLQNNSDLFSKVYFPRLVSPLSSIISKMFRLSLQLIVFVIVYVAYVIRGFDLHPNVYLLIFPLLLLILQGISLGLGLIISSLSVKYRDLRGFFGVFVSLWMYATPIIYPMSQVTNETLRRVMELNPMTSLFEAFKYGAFGAGEFSWRGIAYAAICMIVLLLIGIPLFNRKQKSFIDTV